MYNQADTLEGYNFNLKATRVHNTQANMNVLQAINTCLICKQYNFMLHNSSVIILVLGSCQKFLWLFLKAETVCLGVICRPDKDTIKLLLTPESIAGFKEPILWG